MKRFMHAKQLVYVKGNDGDIKQGNPYYYDIVGS